VAPKGGDGDVESIRLIKVARDTAVKARSQAMITLKSVLVTADDALRGQLEPLTDYQLVTACAQLDVGEVDDAEAACRHALRALARRWLALHEEIKTHAELLETLTTATCPALVEAFGIGTDTAADLLIAAGDDASRIRSDAAYAKLCGAAPIPASSGNTTRHRLSRGGNRQANAALHRIVTVRMRWHEPTKAYVARRTAEGKSKREIMRCLKRYVAREVFRLITAPTHTPLDPSNCQDRLDDL
jgi:transposase